MPPTTVNPSGYIVAPLAAPIAYILTVPVWIALQFGFNLFSLIPFFWQLILFPGIALMSLAVSIPFLWLFRKAAQRFILPDKLFRIFIIALAFLFSGLIYSLIFIKIASHNLFVASFICGLVLNYLVFAKFFASNPAFKRDALKRAP